MKATERDIAPRAMADIVVEAAGDKKAEDILVLNVSEVTTIADLFVICSGRGERRAGTKMTRSSFPLSSAACAIARWPTCTGSKVPPKTPILTRARARRATRARAGRS